MHRLVFEKTGDAVFISHLDLMRVFQRAFRRAGYLLNHTGGFNQHAYVSLLLPLSVGTESVCEILEFEMEADLSDLRDQLNQVLPAGIRVTSVYEGGKKIKELSYLEADVYLEYDRGVPDGAVEAISALFAQEHLTMEKATKRGTAELDLPSMIKKCVCEQVDANTLVLHTIVCAQNPSLNPMMLPKAIAQYRQEFAPDFAHCTRRQMLDGKFSSFR